MAMIKSEERLQKIERDLDQLLAEWADEREELLAELEHFQPCPMCGMPRFVDDQTLPPNGQDG